MEPELLDDARFNIILPKLFKLLNFAERVDKLLNKYHVEKIDKLVDKDFILITKLEDINIVVALIVDELKELSHEDNSLIDNSLSLKMWMHNIKVILFKYKTINEDLDVEDLNRGLKEINYMINVHGNEITRLNKEYYRLHELKEDKEESSWFSWFY